jgi:SNF2 family DNA or RNA helicase
MPSVKIAASTEVTTTPWAHQREGADQFLNRSGKKLLAIPMGGGKSLSTIIAALEADCRSIVILAPASVLNVWRREFSRHSGNTFLVIIPQANHSVAKRAAFISDKVKLAEARRQRYAVVVNYEASWRPLMAACLTMRRWDLLILEESHRIKGYDGAAAKLAARLAPMCRYRMGLTGTPTPHSPLDIFAQARAIDPSVFGTSFFNFKAKYARVNKNFTDPLAAYLENTGKDISPDTPLFVKAWLADTAHRGNVPPQLIGWFFQQADRPRGLSPDLEYINQDEFRARLHDLCWYVDLDGKLDVPPVTDVVIPVTISPAARKVYKQLDDDMYAAIEGGEVTAKNALVKLLRLAQVTSGYLPVDDGGPLVDLDSAKHDVLRDTIENDLIGKRVVVFCRFTRDLAKLRALATDLGRKYGEVSGRQNDLDHHAMMPDWCDLMGVQLQAGGVGVDLTGASVAIYLGIDFNLGGYLQTRARVARPGQLHHVTFLHLVAEDTIDETIYEALANRQDVIEAVIHGGRRPSTPAAGSAPKPVPAA